jgi:hypothetical protein
MFTIPKIRCSSVERAFRSSAMNELMGLDAISARLHAPDERLIVIVRATDAFPVERAPDDHGHQAPHVASERSELLQGRLDVETHSLPAQAVRGGPRVELRKARGGLRGIADVHVIALLPGQHDPGGHGNACIGQSAHHLCSGGTEVFRREGDAGAQLFQLRDERRRKQ